MDKEKQAFEEWRTNGGMIKLFGLDISEQSFGAGYHAGFGGDNN